jgi:hypothetical protein
VDGSYEYYLLVGPLLMRGQLHPTRVGSEGENDKRCGIRPHRFDVILRCMQTDTETSARVSGAHLC